MPDVRAQMGFEVFELFDLRAAHLTIQAWGHDDLNAVDSPSCPLIPDPLHWNIGKPSLGWDWGGL